ncbi:MAG: ABC transporter substrate binding protein [Bryobacteraceae bacterium]
MNPIPRRWFLSGLGVAVMGPRVGEAAESAGKSGAVLVATVPGVEPYQQAVDGLRSRLSGIEVAVADTDPKKLAEALGSGVRTAVAVGAEARAAFGKTETRLPVVSTMVLLAAADDQNSGGQGPLNQAGTVYLDIELPRIAQEIATRLPGKKRLGVIFDGDKRNEPNASVLGELGQQTTVAACERKGDLARAVAGLRGKADIVILMPSSSLYDAESVPPMLQTAIEQRMAVVGFSPGLVQAGAALGVYPDYAEMGVQAGEMVLAVLGKKQAGDETPRKIAVSTNARVLRLLGLKAAK